MMTNTVRKFGVGVATAALVAGVASPALAADDVPRNIAGGWDRIASDQAGADRIDTAIEVAEAAFGDRVAQAKAIYLVNYMAAIDAATAGQLTQGPILLVNDNSRVIEQVKNYAKKFTSATTVYAIGGTKAVSDETLKAVANGKTTARLGGTDRFETALSVAKQVVKDEPSKSKTVLIAQSQIPVDALTAGTLDAGPVLLVDAAGQLPESAKKWIEENKPSTVIGLGGKKVVPDAALSEASLPGIIENPTATADELRKARQKAKDARALYLGNNVFADESANPNKISVELASDATAVTGTDPKKVDTVLAGRPDQWKGYKAQLEEAKALEDRTSTAVTAIKAEFTNWLKDNPGQPIAAAQATAKLVAKKLYGMDGTTNLDADAFILDGNNKVIGLSYDYLAGLTAYKTALKTALDNVKRYSLSKADAATVLVDAISSKALPTADTKLTTLVSSNPGVAVAGLDQVAKALLQIASSNATAAESDMLAAIAALPSGARYERLWGADRYGTAAAIANYWRNRQHVPSDLKKVYLANGETMIDALVGGVLTDGPILLVGGDGKLTDETAKELVAIGANTRNYQTDDPVTVYAIGGTKAVADATAQAAADKIREGFKTLPDSQTPVSALALAQSSVTMTGIDNSTGKDVDLFKNNKAVAATENVTVAPVSSYGAGAPTVTWANGKVHVVTDADPAAGEYKYKITLGSDSVVLTVNQELWQLQSVAFAAGAAGVDAANPVNVAKTGTLTVKSGALEVKDKDGANVAVTNTTIKLNSAGTITNVGTIDRDDSDDTFKVDPSGTQVANTAATYQAEITVKVAGYEAKNVTIPVYIKVAQ